MVSGLFNRFRRLALIAILAAPVVITATWNLFFYLYGPPRGETSAWVGPQSARADIPLYLTDPNRRITDDAGRSCRCRDMAQVELRVLSDDQQYIGHAFLHTPARTVGFRTNEEEIGVVDYLNPFAPLHPGFIRDDSPTNYDFVLAYRACPVTRRFLESAIDDLAHAAYQVGGWKGGLNCATWALTCLRRAGLPVPGGRFPNELARHMNRRPVQHVAASPAQRPQ